MIPFENILPSLRCSACKGVLMLAPGFARCGTCGSSYPITKERISFLKTTMSTEVASGPSDTLIYRMKLLVKKSPRLFTLLNHTLGTYVGKSAKQAIAGVPRGTVILNIGAGAEVIREDVLNIDLHPYAGVHIVADVHTLPFKDGSVDAVIAESVLEHLKDPIRAVAEMRRVLKQGGLVYITTPFIIGYHSSPGDYYRWTTSGLRELLKGFTEQELGIAVGPTNALTYILREWLATVLSFNSVLLYQLWIMFFMALFAPINLLDHLLKRYKTAPVIAHLYYFVGSKP